MLSCEGRKIRDNAPEIRAAGKLISSGHGTKECFSQDDGGRVTPNAVKCIRGGLRPEAGLAWGLWSRMGGPPMDNTNAHGIVTKSSYNVKEFVNPPPINNFKQSMLNQSESLYHSRKTAPLGMAHDQQAQLPAWINPTHTCFGIETVRDESAGMIVSPQKTRKEVDEEYDKGRDLYKKSHDSWAVGEGVDRNYDWSKFSKTSAFGVSTPHDSTGSQTNIALHNWLYSIEGRVIAERLDAYRERAQPQLGQVHDPIVETLHVSPDHSFGVMVEPDEFSAGDLMHMEGSTIFSEHPVLDEGVLAVIRNFLKTKNFHNFQFFLDALQILDKEECGLLPKDVVREMSFQFGLPLTSDMLEMLLHWCIHDGGEGGGEGGPTGRVAYKKFVMLLNWKVPMEIITHTKIPASSSNNNASMEATPIQGDGATCTIIGTVPAIEMESLKSKYRTSSQCLQATAGSIPTSHLRCYGVPTIRSDLPAPIIRRVGDTKNYGDEASCYNLLYPSIYANHRVYEEDLFKPRTQEQLSMIFEGTGIAIPPDLFEVIWEEAVKRNSKGEVSVASFREVVQHLQSQQAETCIKQNM